MAEGVLPRETRGEVDFGRALVRAGWLLGVVACVVAWFWFAPLPASDLRWYWAAGFDLGSLYDRAEQGFSNGSNYSPAFFQLTAWLSWLPFEVVTAAYRAFLYGLVLAMAGPLTAPVLLLVPVESEIAAGNIQLVMAAAICVGFRYPAAWAFVLLSKVSPGIGLLWFVYQRQWRHLVIAIGTTAAIAAVSFVVAPDLWFGWAKLLSQPQPAPSPFYWPLWARLPIAIAFLVMAQGRRWPVIFAATMALPVFYTISPSMLVGAVYLARTDRR